MTSLRRPSSGPGAPTRERTFGGGLVGAAGVGGVGLVGAWLGFGGSISSVAWPVPAAAFAAPLLGLFAFVSPAAATLPCWASSHPGLTPDPLRPSAAVRVGRWLRSRW